MTDSPSQIELSLEASNMVLRMALRIMLGDYIYNNFRDVLINDFRGLEINGTWGWIHWLEYTKLVL